MLRKIDYLGRAALLLVWFAFCCVVSWFMLIFKWKNPSVGSYFARMLAWGGLLIMGYKVRIDGLENAYKSQPCIYVATHQSNLDIVTYSKIFPRRTVVIGKKELKWLPFFNILFAGSGMIMIDRKNRTNSIAGLDQATEAITKKGHSIWIFPEGTRNRGSKELLPFKKGAFYMAINAQVPIVPLVHQHLKRYFDFEQGRVRRDGDIVIKILEPIPTKGMKPDQVSELMHSVRAKMQETLNLPELRPIDHA